MSSYRTIAREYYNRPDGDRDPPRAFQPAFQRAPRAPRHAARRSADGFDDALSRRRNFFGVLRAREPARLAHAGHAAAPARRAVDRRDRRPARRSVHADAGFDPGRSAAAPRAER